MKKLFLSILSLLLLFSGNSQPSQTNKTLGKKIDSLISIVKSLESKKNDTTHIKLDKLDEVFKKTDPKWYEKFLPAIIALLTVLISSGVAYYVGARNARTQLTNAQTQANTQIAIAADQLQVSRLQIEQNTKNTLAQIRSNNISKARIEWVQDLRPLLSSFLERVVMAEELFDEAMQLHKSNDNKAHEIAGKTITTVHELRLNIHQILLFLNSEERSHKELEDAMSFLIANIEKGEEINKEDFKEEYNQVLEKFRTVLKEAWEQAKSETNI